MNDKYLSIITNFGCHWKCHYCIVKNTGISVPQTTIESLDNLWNAVQKTNANIISLSGGGDPLFEYEKHTDYYNRLFDFSKSNGIPIEMHTSYINDRNFPYEKCLRVVYHCHSLQDMKNITRHGHEIIRAVFVVTKDFTYERIEEIAGYVNSSSVIDELSFRQMIDENYQTTDYCREYLKKGHKKNWWYIEQGDYNLYFVNGEIYNKYSELKTGG